MTDTSNIQARLKSLSDAYAETLPDKLMQLEMLWSQWQMNRMLAHDEWDESGFQAMIRLAHGLSGSAKTFGFGEIGNVARKLELYLQPIGEARQVLSDEQCNQVKRLLRQLGLSALHREVASLSVPVALAQDTKVSAQRRVIVVEDDLDLVEELKTQLNYYGYEVDVIQTLAEFRRVIQRDHTGVVLMDINFPEDSLGGIHVMQELQRDRSTPLPVIYLSSHTELDIRLGAVRAGSVAYLSKPVNIGELVDELDKLTSTVPPSAFRVMIVDDDIELAQYCAAALEQAGMVVKTVSDPLKVMKPLFEFAPDLIMIDLYMPGCTGEELAKALRQIKAFVSIPIVFLSAETDLDKQLAVLGMGVDDFLTKPIKIQHLISAVSSRIHRSLMLRSYMVRDSLTGLLNHTAIKEQLNHEMVRAKRQGNTLAFAMIDIDHFKAVNDSYGHPVGDRVLKSLARLLKQRLRENDLIGRYGGEEFAVVLVDADGETARKIMEGIRNDFALLRHLSGDEEFSVSFSCGIAHNSQYDDPTRLTDAADKALYRAKHAGRNQVVLADNA